MSDRVEERAIAALETKRLSGEYAEKSKIIDRMRTELSEITSAFNARIEYYVQLQKLSDDVSDPNFSARSWKGITEEIEMKLAEEGESGVPFEFYPLLTGSVCAAKFEIEIINSSVQIRYLTSLTDQPEEDGGSYCVICTESYDKGSHRNPSPPFSSIDADLSCEQEFSLHVDTCSARAASRCGEIPRRRVRSARDISREEIGSVSFIARIRWRRSRRRERKWSRIRSDREYRERLSSESS